MEGKLYYFYNQWRQLSDETQIALPYRATTWEKETAKIFFYILVRRMKKMAKQATKVCVCGGGGAFFCISPSSPKNSTVKFLHQSDVEKPLTALND